VFGGMQKLFGLFAVPGHIVVVGGTGVVHLMDGLNNMSVDGIQIMPVMDVRKSSAGNECQAKSGDYKSLFHSVSSGTRFYPIL
jgi:hypothetical protein